MVNAIAVDVGNSSIKLATTGSKTQSICRLRHDFDAAELARFVIQSNLSNPAWYICSVDQQTTTALIAKINDQFADAKVTQLRHANVPLTIDVDAAERVGMDRLVAAWAARQSFDNQTLIVVDAGTAVTVDVVVDRRFTGGLIFPGPKTSLAALHSHTDALPNLADRWDGIAGRSVAAIEVGDDSETAILLGVHQHFFCGLQLLVNRLQQQHPGSQIVCTGGILKHGKDCIGGDWAWMEGLVLQGVSLLAHRTCMEP